MFNFKDECHTFLYFFSLPRYFFEREDKKEEKAGREGRKKGREKTGRKQGREGGRERSGDRGGRLSISDPVMSITKIKTHGSPGHPMKAMTQFP